MPEIKFTNNAISVLNGALTNVATTINVAAGEGAKFPTLAAGDWFYATLEEAAPAAPAFPLREIVKVTARSSDALTVTRGQDGTAARAWLSGDKIELRWTAATMADLRAERNALMVSKAGDTMTGNLVVPSMNGGPLAGFRNKVINGAFDVWQRGTGPFTAAAKSADMWNISWDGTGGTRSVSRVTHPAGDELDGQFQHIRWTQTAAGTATWNSLEALIEYVRTLNGKQVTLSFWARDTTTPRTINFLARQIFGIGGSTQVDSTTTNFNLTTSWAKYTYTFNLPGIGGKTLGTDSKLALIFLMPLTAFTIDIANVQLEEGPVATPFESRPISVEQQLCWRYYFRVQPGAGGTIFGNSNNVSTTAAMVIVHLPVYLRAQPAIETNGTAGDYAVYTGVWVTLSSLPVLSHYHDLVVWLNFNTGGSLVAGQAGQGRSNGANSAFLAFNSEL